MGSRKLKVVGLAAPGFVLIRLREPPGLNWVSAGPLTVSRVADLLWVSSLTPPTETLGLKLDNSFA